MLFKDAINAVVSWRREVNQMRSDLEGQNWIHDWITSSRLEFNKKYGKLTVPVQFSIPTDDEKKRILESYRGVNEKVIHEFLTGMNKEGSVDEELVKVISQDLGAQDVEKAFHLSRCLMLLRLLGDEHAESKSLYEIFERETGQNVEWWEVLSESTLERSIVGGFGGALLWTQTTLLVPHILIGVIVLLFTFGLTIYLSKKGAIEKKKLEAIRYFQGQIKKRL